MKLIRHLLSHALLLAFLIALAFAYHYRGQLFSADINATIDNTVHKVMVLVKLIPKTSKPSAQELSLIHISEPTRQLMSSRMPSSA